MKGGNNKLKKVDMNNNILIGAEGLDGANFLCSCLTMSKNVYFNNVSIEEKKEYFFKGMSEIQEKNGVPIWTDVSMLFHDCARKGSKLSFSTYQCKLIYESVKSTLVDKSLISKVRLPIFWPLSTLIKTNPKHPLVKLFESKYFIGLINPDLFIHLRTVLNDSHFLDTSIPNLNLLTVSDFKSLPKDLQERIKSKYSSTVERLFRCDILNINKWDMSNMECDIKFKNIIKNEYKNMNLYKESNDLIKDKITFQWNCNWFLSENETIENIKILYNDLSLGECDENLIREMYKVWINRIDYVKKTYVESFNIRSINNDMFTI